jgi:hypothetical protein
MSIGRSANSSYGFSDTSSNSSSNAVSQSSGQSTSGQSIAFEDVFNNLYRGASSAAGGAVAGAAELGQTARQLFTGGSQFLDSLGNNSGMDALNQRINDDGSVLNGQLDQLREQTGRLFSEEINPAITSRAVGGGNLGGGRQGVAQALGAEKAGQVFTSGATSLIANNQQQKDQAAAQVLQGTIGAASTGLGALPGLLDLQTKGNSAQLGVYSTLAGILGGPTTLSSSQSTQDSNSIATMISEAFGHSYNYGHGIEHHAGLT